MQYTLVSFVVRVAECRLGGLCAIRRYVAYVLPRFRCLGRLTPPHRDAPHFDGTPLHLPRYFGDVDKLYASLGLTPGDAEKIEQTIYYLDADTASLWEGLQPPAGQVFTWDTFKSAVMVLYPGSDTTRLYWVQDLEGMVQG